MSSSNYVIWKHELPFSTGYHTLELTAPGSILDVQIQGNKLVLWEIHRAVDTKTKPVRLLIAFTGVEFPFPDEGQQALHLSTVQDRHGLVWHIWIVEPR